MPYRQAKDELIGPATYLALAQQMRENATNEREREAAEKALEVARVYASSRSILKNITCSISATSFFDQWTC